MGIALKNVDFTYQQGTPFEGKALSSINLEIPDGSYTAIIGHTGSGKSTLLQLLNGLLKPTKGEVQFGSYSISALSEPKEMKYMRKKVGLVFQFPENQLFSETILTDVAFGPQNFGIEKEEAEKLAKEKLALVGIEEELYEKSPFELSGGQMRRVAIAGILAMEPEVLVLDEPTAGLDPSGRRELMDLFQSLHQNGLTIVLVTHTMDDVADFADHVFVLDHGKLVMEGAPNIIFQRVKELETIQLGVPKITKFAYSLQKKGLNLEYLPVTIPEFKEMLVHE